MALEGDLSLFGLSDVLQVVAQQRKTGILTVQGKTDILAVSFLKGEIVAADALNQSFEGLLGEVLASRGTVSPDRFALLADRQRSSGERLIDFLVKQGIVGREELLDALRELTYRLLVDMLRWREGQFKFYGGEEVAFEEGIHPLRVDEVLMRALRDGAGEPGRAAETPHGYLAYTRVASGRETRVIPEGFDESTPLDPSVTWLTPDEARLLERLDGRTPAEMVAHELGLGETKTYFALHRLLQAGLARPAREDEAPAGPRLAPLPPPAAPAAASAAPRADSLRLERAVLRDLEPAAAPSHPLRRLADQGRVALPLAVGALLLALALRVPGLLLFPTPELAGARDSFDRLRRLSRHDLIDRSARTYHLLEGRYPASLGELVERGLLPARAQRDPSGAPYRISSKAEEYQLFVASEDGAGGAREGVFGDFLLDRGLFAQLDDERGVPLVLVD
jgi:predicted transcriptional regulator